MLTPPEDPHWRAEFTVYSTNGWTVGPEQGGGRCLLRRIEGVPPRATTIVADLSSLITLHHLGFLDRAASYFGRILLPASYSEFPLLEQTEYQPHQPSRLDAARQIRDAVDRGHITALPAGTDSLPLLDEYGDGSAHSLHDVVSWLHEQGQIDEARASELLARLRNRDADSSLPPIAEVARRGFRTTVMTLEAAIQAGLFPILSAAMRLSLAAEDVAEVRSRLWASEHQARLAQENEALWAAIQGDERLEPIEVARPVPDKDFLRDRRGEAVFDAPLLAEARKLPLLVHDRAFQAVILNGRTDATCPAFGTDCLLVALAESGAVTEDELADAFLSLIRRRYRFLVPPVRVLTTFAVRHRAHPPGLPLREVSRYVHDCFSDPGLLAGLEPTDPPVSVASESYRYWVQQVARFVVSVWNDERFDDRTAREFTDWAFGELLPSPPLTLPRMGAVVLCQLTAHFIVLTAYSEVWRFKNSDRAAKAIAEVAAALRLTKTEYLEIAGDYLDFLSTHSATGEDPEAMLEVNGLLAQMAIAPVRAVGLRVYFALARLGVVTEPPAMPSPDTLAAVLDPTHERRIANPPGPVVLLHGVGNERAGDAICIPDYLLHPARTVRDTALTYLRVAPEGPASWLSPRSQAALAEAAHGILNEVQEEWLPAAKRVSDVLEEDFLLNLAGFRQCWEANLRAEQDAYWRRVIRPGVQLAASIPVAWYDIPSAEAAGATAYSFVGDVVSLPLLLDDYFRRFGHLPLAPPASAGSVVRKWAETSGRGAEAWDAVWQWADAGSSPLRAYHACQVFLECPEFVPEGQSAAFWRTRGDSMHHGGRRAEGVQ